MRKIPQPLHRETELYKRTVSLPPDLSCDVLTDVDNYWIGVLEVMEKEAKLRSSEGVESITKRA